MRPLKASSLGFGSALLSGLLGLAAAAIALRQATSGGAWRAPEFVPLLFAGVALVFAAVVVGALGHLVVRRDVSRQVKLLLGVGAVLLPGGAVIYLALGPARTKALGERGLRAFERATEPEPGAA